MPETLIRRMTVTALSIATLLFVGASMAFNFVAWRGQGSGFIGDILGGASIGSDLFKATLPLVIAGAWAKRHWPSCALTTLVFLGCLAFSLAGALGMASLSRNQAIGGREAAAVRLAATEQELRNIEGQLAAIGTSRPQAVIEKTIEQAKQDRRWLASDSCNASVNESLRNYCKGIATLRTELASAIAAEKLRERAKILHDGMTILLAAGVRAKLDGQAEIIAELLGFSVAKVQTSLSVMVTLILELGAAFGLYLVSLALRTTDATSSKPLPLAEAEPLKQPVAGRFIRSGGKLMIEYK